jgi:hypothetical protein
MRMVSKAFLEMILQLPELPPLPHYRACARGSIRLHGHLPGDATSILGDVIHRRNQSPVGHIQQPDYLATP